MARRPKTTAGASSDPLAELRKNIENLDSIEQALGVASKAETAGPKPPPLPQGEKKRARPLAQSTDAPWVPGDFLFPEIPPPLPDPGDNPFNEQPETRMPRAAAPEEKVDFFRGIVKAKSEALARAKSLYGARIDESKRLREVIQALGGQLARIAPLQSLPKELDTLREQLADAERRADRVEEAESELDATARRCVDLEQAIETFEVKLLKLQSQIKSEKQATNDANEANDQLQLHIREKDVRIGDLEAILAEREAGMQAFERLQADFTALEAKMAATEAQVALREAMQKKLESDLASMKEQLRQEKAEYEQMLSQQQRTSADALSEQETQLDQKRIHELEAQRANYQAECRALQGQLDVAQAQLQLAREESEKFVVEKEEARQKLLRKMSEMKKALTDQQAESLAQAESQRQTEVAELQRALDAAKKETARKLSERETALREEFEVDLSLERKMGQEREQTLSEQYENEIKVLEAHLSKAQESVDKSRADLDAARDEMKQAESAAAQKLAHQRKELLQQKAEAIEDSEAQHQTFIEGIHLQHRSDLEAVQDAKAALESELYHVRESLAQANAELESWSAQSDVLHAELARVKAEHATLEEALKAARTRASSLEVKSQQDSQSSAEQERALDSLKAELSLAREKLETSRQASAALRQENRRLQQEVSTQMQQARSQANQVEDSLSDAQEKARQFEMKSGQLQRRIDMLTQELAESRAVNSEEATQALEREMSARKAAESRARDLEKALSLATQTLREAAKAGMTAPPAKVAK